MPNWCENDLTVEGPTEVIEEFLKFAAGESPFDFDRFIPYPEEFRRLDEAAKAWDREHAGRPDYDWRRGRKMASTRAAMTGVSRIGARSGPPPASSWKGRCRDTPGRRRRWCSTSIRHGARPSRSSRRRQSSTRRYGSNSVISSAAAVSTGFFVAAVARSRQTSAARISESGEDKPLVVAHDRLSREPPALERAVIPREERRPCPAGFSWTRNSKWSALTGSRVVGLFPRNRRGIQTQVKPPADPEEKREAGERRAKPGDTA